MKRSPISPSTTPMKRTPMKRSTIRMKSTRPKMTAIRRSARNRECTIRLPMVCNFDPATTVLCHSNELADGKGMGIKAPDSKAAFGCSACHDVLDGRAPRPEGLTLEMVQSCFREAIDQTQRIVNREGLA